LTAPSSGIVLHRAGGRVVGWTPLFLLLLLAHGVKRELVSTDPDEKRLPLNLGEGQHRPCSVGLRVTNKDGLIVNRDFDTVARAAGGTLPPHHRPSVVVHLAPILETPLSKARAFKHSGNNPNNTRDTPKTETRRRNHSADALDGDHITAFIVLSKINCAISAIALRKMRSGRSHLRIPQTPGGRCPHSKRTLPSV
jgi:hypothetical protein